MGGHNTARAVSPRFEVRPPDHKRLKAPPSPRSYNDYLIATHGTASPRGGQSGFIHDRSSGGLSPRRPERVQLEKLEPLSKGVLPLLEPPPRLRASQGTNLLSQPRQPVKSLGPWRPPFPRVPLLADMPPPATPVQMYLVRPLSPSRKLMATDPAAAANPEGLGPPAVDPVGIVWQGVSGRRRERLRAAIPRAELRGGAPSAKSRAKLDTEGESIGSSEAEGADAEVRPRARPRPRPRSEAEAEAAGFLCWAGAGSLTMPTAAELLLARCVGTEAYHRCVGTPAELRQGMGPGGRKGAGSPRRAKSGMESPPEAGAEAGADGGAEAMTESMTWQTQKAISGLEAAATVIEASEEFVAARVASARRAKSGEITHLGRSPEGLAVAKGVAAAGGSAAAGPAGAAPAKAPAAAADVAPGEAEVPASEAELDTEAALIQSASRALNAAANHGVLVQPVASDDAGEVGLEVAGLEAAAHLVAAALDEVLAVAIPG